MTVNTFIAEFFYCIIGVIFILVGLKALRDSNLKTRITTALFWFILAFTFIVGPHIPYWITGLCVNRHRSVDGVQPGSSERQRCAERRSDKNQCEQDGL